MADLIEQARRLAEQGAEVQDGEFQLALCEWAASDGLEAVLAALPAEVAWVEVTRGEDTRINSQVPVVGNLIWIHDAFYHGVTVGRFVFGGFETADGSDDVGVTHWAPLTAPSAP